MKIKNKITAISLFALSLSSILVACNPSTDISTQPSTEPTPPTSEIEYKTLSSPVLSLNEDNGLVTWNKVESAEYYRYYINNGDIQSTTNNEIQLRSGQSISVVAESSKDNILSSEWSTPVIYFEKTTITEYITIYFHNTSIKPTTLLKGSTFKPSTPTKDLYEFKGWYLDSYYTKPLTDDHQFNETTILFANFVEKDLIKNVSYWVKASPNVSSKVISTTTSSTGWRHIPLTPNETKSKEKGKIIFSADVTVSNVTASNLAYFIVMDGLVDNSGRTYYKNGDQDFNILSNGTYRIYFSVEHTWNNGVRDVNCHVESLNNSSAPKNLYNDSKFPQFSSENSNELESVSLNLNPYDETVSWEPIENATSYEYVIDNGNIQSTTSNNIPLYQGSHIVVRATTTKSGFLPSKWSSPVKQAEPEFPQFVYVYYHGSNRPSSKVEYGGQATRPTNNPVKPGYNFVDWYEDVAHKTKFDFNKKLYKNTVIYAKFEYSDETKYALYESNKTKKVTDFAISEQYSWNEYVAKYTVSTNTTYYVKKLSDGTFFGPYEMESTGNYAMYFSEEHRWDVGTSKERNAYWSPTTKTFYFTNTKNWDKVYYYTWTKDNVYKNSWPGAAMTYAKTNSYGQNIYKVTIEDIYVNIIFNNTSGEQTCDIDLSNVASGTGFYISGNKEGNAYPVSTYTYQ